MMPAAVSQTEMKMEMSWASLTKIIQMRNWVVFVFNTMGKPIVCT